MNKIRVLFVTQVKLHHYRLPIYRLVNNDPNIELTLAHCGAEVVQHGMPEILLKREKRGPFSIFKDFESICEQFDVILCMFYYDNLSILNMVRKKNKKVVLWSIGVPASYNRLYGDAPKIRYKIMYHFQRKADALLLYSDAPKAILKEKGVKLDENKVFVANNTVDVIKQPVENDAKNSLLFIGTLYLEKGVQILLDAYKAAYEEQKELLPLTIIGGGHQFDLIKAWVKKAGLEQKINMTGAIYDSVKKAEYFKRSIACISPKQAGLSVLESMGYGVPFITSYDAITGGEAFNIKDGENGLRMADITELKEVILDIHHNRGKYLKMGEKAYEYYWKNRTPDVMANGIIAAINYAANNHNSNK